MRKIVLLLAILLPFLQMEGKEGKSPVGTVITSAPAAPTIVLDAGHGGTDRGARSHFPYCEEKRLCLQTARLVKQYLDQLGYHVIMTRATDAFVPLPHRVEVANSSSCNIFVSIHFNSSKSTSAQGIEVFFHDSKGVRSNASKKLADSILTRLLRRTSAQSRGVKKGNFYVIRETQMPAVLIEAGFITNPDEKLLIKSRDYQEKLARGVADGIDAYFKARWRKK